MKNEKSELAVYLLKIIIFVSFSIILIFTAIKIIDSLINTDDSNLEDITFGQLEKDMIFHEMTCVQRITYEHPLVNIQKEYNITYNINNDIDDNEEKILCEKTGFKECCK